MVEMFKDFLEFLKFKYKRVLKVLGLFFVLVMYFFLWLVIVKD